MREKISTMVPTRNKINGAIDFHKKHPFLSVSTILSIFMLTSLIIMASMARIVADDYNYFSAINQGSSPLDYINYHYFSHNGRLSQATFMAFVYSWLGELSIKIVPIFLLLSLVASVSYLINLIFTFKNLQKIKSLVSGTLISSIILFSMPSLFDSFLWLTSSTVYLTSIIGLVVNISLAIKIKRSKSKLSWKFMGPALIFMFFSQSFSEPTAAVAIGLAGLWLVYELVSKNKEKIIASLQVFLALTLGFLLLFLSPGTRNREGAIGHTIDLHRILISSIKHYITMFNNIELWMVALIALAALFIALNLKGQTNIKKSLPPLVISLIIFTSFTYGTFVVNNYAGTYYPSRNFTLPTVGFVLGLGLFLVTAFKLIIDYGRKNYLIQPGLTLIVIVFFALSAPEIIRFSSAQIKALSIRDSLMTVRNYDVREQLELEKTRQTKTIEIKASPVILANSNAEDVKEPSKEQIDWLIAGIKAYYGIPQDYEFIVTETYDTYCIENINYIKHDYVCSIKRLDE